MPEEEQGSTAESEETSEGEEKETTEETSDDSEDSEEQETKESDEDGEKKQAKKSKSVPFARFHSVNEKAKKALRVVDWYQKNVGSPEEVLEYQKWKKSQGNGAKETEPTKEEKTLAGVRELMLKAFPALSGMEKAKEPDEEAEEAVLDLAEEELLSVCKDLGVDTKKEKLMHRIGSEVMQEIRTDAKLSRLWKLGQMRCVTIAAKRVIEDLGLTKPSKPNFDTKRQALKASSPGGAPAVASSPAFKQKSPGITKETHKNAWARIQQALE